MGDRVLSAPEDSDGRQVAARSVTAVYERTSAMLEVRVAGSSLRLTEEYPVHVVGRGWRTARELQAGDEVLSSQGTVAVIDGVALEAEPCQVYNVTVDEYHTYFVGLADGAFDVWLHNVDPRCAQLKTLQSQLNELLPGDLKRAELEQRSTALEDDIALVHDNSLEAAKAQGMSVIEGLDAPDRMVEVTAKLKRAMTRQEIREKIHKVKELGNVEAAEDLVFDRSGGIWDSRTGEYLQKMWE